MCYCLVFVNCSLLNFKVKPNKGSPFLPSRKVKALIIYIYVYKSHLWTTRSWKKGQATECKATDFSGFEHCLIIYLRPLCNSSHTDTELDAYLISNF